MKVVTSLFLSILLYANCHGQTSESLNQIKKLLEMAKVDFKSIIGHYDSTLNSNISLFTVDQTKDNSITLDTTVGISLFTAYVRDSIKFSEAKKAVEDWVQNVRPIFINYKESYVQKHISPISQIYEQYEFTNQSEGSEYTFNIWVRKNETNKFYTVSFSILRQWKSLW